MMIDIEHVREEVERALLEDIGAGDVTAALLPEDELIHAKILSREAMVVAGIPWVDMAFHLFDESVSIQWEVKDGQVLSHAQTLCHLIGKARSILTAERTALNFLQMLSGVASKTRHYLEAMASEKVRLLDTRKTLPGLRLAQKYAVFCGGGSNHRFGLYDAYLIKENHIHALGSVKRAIEHAKSNQDGLLIEVEVEDLQQLQEALLAKPHRILLDNFSIPMLEAAVKMNQPRVCDLEASGGIDIENIALIAKTGVDYISVGDLTKSVRSIDLSLLCE